MAQALDRLRAIEGPRTNQDRIASVLSELETLKRQRRLTWKQVHAALALDIPFSTFQSNVQRARFKRLYAATEESHATRQAPVRDVQRHATAPADPAPPLPRRTANHAPTRDARSEVKTSSSGDGTFAPRRDMPNNEI
jgi:predicted DNA-binding protein (UPF0251 family)